MSDIPSEVCGVPFAVLQSTEARLEWCFEGFLPGSNAKHSELQGKVCCDPVHLALKCCRVGGYILHSGVMTLELALSARCNTCLAHGARV